jgi:hypothetical protein
VSTAGARIVSTLRRRRFVGAVLALALPMAAGAADWQRVSSVGNDQHYYDRSKVTIAGDEVTYWRKVVFAKPVRVKSGTAKIALYRERMHCRDHTLRALSWQLLADEGAVIEASNAPEPEPSPVVPETVGDRFQAVMCALADSARQRDVDIARDEAQLAARRKELEALRAEVERLEATLGRLRSEAAAMLPKPETSPETPPKQ